ncbi:MAG: AraC family transcriptional regulator [Pseudomonadales bacterium]|nr:AraC family transcriptional regulator [Pseudomonadales bacterium]
MWAIYSSFAELNRKIMPSSIAVVLINAIRESGIEVDELRKKYQLSDERLLDVNEMVSPIEVQLFILQAIGEHEHVPVSFHYGKKLGVNLMGDLGQVMMAAGTIREAIFDLAEYVKTFNYLVDYHIEETEEELFLVPNLGLYSCGPDYNLRFSMETALTSCLSILNFLSGDGVVPQAAYFSYKESKYPDAYQQLFGDNIVYGAKRNMLVFNQKEIAKPVVTGNPFVHEMYKKRCEEKLRQIDNSKTIECLVLNFLKREQEIPPFEKLAFGLGFTPSALRRRLVLAETSYQDLVDRVRLDRAEGLLRQHGRSVESIALQLGFADASNFRRAFKRWTGETPSEFRKQYA